MPVLQETGYDPAHRHPDFDVGYTSGPPNARLILAVADNTEPREGQIVCFKTVWPFSVYDNFREGSFMIPELLKSVAGSITRWALTGIAAYLVSKGVIKGEDAETLVIGAGMGLAALAWSLYQKHRDRLKFNVALSLPAHSTEEEVNREVKMRAGNVSVWSIALLLLLIPVSLTSACNEDQLKAVASNVDRVAVLIADGREVRDELFTQGIIDRDDAYRVTVGLQRINTALRVFNAKARTYKTVTPEAKGELKKLAEDIAGAASELVSDGTFGIKNADAQVRINAAIGSIRQVALALVDTIERLKTKSAPVQQAGFPPLAILPLLLLGLRQIVAFVDRERRRTGKTAEEVFAEAGAQLDANESALIADLVKYAPEGEVSEAAQAKLDAFYAHLTNYPVE